MFLIVHSFHDVVEIFVNGWVVAHHQILEEVLTQAVDLEQVWASCNHDKVEMWNEVGIHVGRYLFDDGLWLQHHNGLLYSCQQGIA